MRCYTEDATLHLVLRAAPGGRSDTRRAPPDRPPLPLAAASCRDQVFAIFDRAPPVVEYGDVNIALVISDLWNRFTDGQARGLLS